LSSEVFANMHVDQVTFEEDCH